MPLPIENFWMEDSNGTVHDVWKEPENFDLTALKPLDAGGWLAELYDCIDDGCLNETFFDAEANQRRDMLLFIARVVYNAIEYPAPAK